MDVAAVNEPARNHVIAAWIIAALLLWLVLRLDLLPALLAGLLVFELVHVLTMRLNFVRVRQVTHAVLPHMIERNWGRVINISGKSEPSGLLAASPAKAAIHAWSKGLSREVGPHGITVNCIPPGRIMSEQIRAKYSPEFRTKQSAEEIPVGRYGEPEELAALAVFLASPVASYITGAVLPVDGGLRRYAF